MPRKRIQVYADDETKRRIELAAAQHELAVTEYCLEAIKQQLMEDDLLESNTVEIAVRPAREATLIDDLRALQAKISAQRKGKPIEVDNVIERLRDERDHELSHMH